MRAGRLIELVLLLQRRGRTTARELARELEVSERTVLRDLETLSGAGIPVFATRGPGGGFQLLDGHRSGLELMPSVDAPVRGRRPGQRARVRITAEGRRIVALTGVLQPLRIVRVARSGAADGHEATFPIRSHEGTIVELLSLGPEVEVLDPPSLRSDVARRVHATAGLYPEARSVTRRSGARASEG